MSAHVLLNLLNELGKPRILSLFRNKFNKFNNTGARMLDSTYHMTLNMLKLLKIAFFGVKTSIFCHILRNVLFKWTSLRYVTKSVND